MPDEIFFLNDDKKRSYSEITQTTIKNKYVGFVVITINNYSPR
jgi:hypothetical protein